MGLTALCPGTFDPVTYGHLDIIGRTATLFDAVAVAVVENPSKTPLFTLEERVALLEEAVGDLPGVTVAPFRGLLVDHARAFASRSSRSRTIQRACLISSGSPSCISAIICRTSSRFTSTEDDSGIDFASRTSSSSCASRVARSISRVRSG